MIEKILEILKGVFLKRCDFCDEQERSDDPFLYHDDGTIGHKSCWISEEMGTEKVRLQQEVDLMEARKHIFEIEAAALRQENHDMLQFIYVLIKLSGGKVRIPTAEMIMADGENFSVSHDVVNKAIVLSIEKC